MKVVLSTWGRFHFFHLARQFEKRGQLEAIFTTYPMFKLRDEGLPSELIRSDAVLETLLRGKSRFGLANAAIDGVLDSLKVSLHDRYLRRHMPDCDIFIALSGSGAQAGPAIQGRGGRYVCERGASHIAYRDDLLTEEFQRWKMPFLPTTEAFIRREEVEYRVADRIVVPSSYAKRSFVERGVAPDKIIINGYGAELARFSKVADPPEGGFEVLYVGGVRLGKGLPYLVEAFGKLRHPKKRLTLVGEVGAEMRSYFRDAAMDGVEVVGGLPNEQLSLLMSKSHVLVLPSIDDGFGLVMAEAMACGCPVIATTNTGAEDLFEDGVEGFIVPIRDPAAIADRLQEFADDPDKRHRFGQAARQRIEGLGGWDRYGERYEALCRALMAGDDVPFTGGTEK